MSNQNKKIRVGDVVTIGRWGYFWNVTGFSLGVSNRATLTRPFKTDAVAHVGGVYLEALACEKSGVTARYGSITTRAARGVIQEHEQ